MDDQATMQAAEKPRRPAFLNRFWMVFVQPGKLFESLGRNPAWFPITLFVAVATGAIALLIPFELVEEQMRAWGMASGDIDAARGLATIATVAGTIIFLPIMTVVVST
ncbi:MAG: hypothetical protein F4187_05130, partial [Gemmatimonadetes bacterium]|nr:hypothetical protein [Gemmatimonadota bacterium]